MIDYYLKKHCSLTKDKVNVRCSGCIWRDKILKKCLFSLDFPRQISVREIEERIKLVDENQQKELSDPKRRFVL